METVLSVFAAEHMNKVVPIFNTVHFLFRKIFGKKGLRDYRVVTLVSKTDGVRSSALPRSDRAVELFPKLRL